MEHFEHLPIFVYGTLKRGEERAGMWPHAAVKIQNAATRARLFDLGSYPAIVDGNDRVGGELWFVEPAHLAEMIRILDEIECFGNDDVDLYVRRIVDCFTDDGGVQPAYTYFLADLELLGNRVPIAADTDGVCHWRRYSTSS